jgi:hypothetical protein
VSYLLGSEQLLEIVRLSLVPKTPCIGKTGPLCCTVNANVRADRTGVAIWRVRVSVPRQNRQLSVRRLQ